MATVRLMVFVLRASLVIAAAMSTTACFSSATVVRVRPDGSGTIHVTSALRRMALAQIEAVTGAHGDKPSNPRLADWFPEQRARAAASGLGQNVRFVSSRAIDNEELLGRVTLYEFTDIRLVTLEPIPVFPADASFGADAKLEGEHRFTFDLVDEGENGQVLVARLPDARIQHAGFDWYAAQSEPPNPEDLALLRTFVTGCRLEVTVEPDLPIVRTNTPHVNGQQVTLVKLDAEPLLLDDIVARRLPFRPGSLDEIRYQLHDAPGVTVSLDREIRIELTRISAAHLGLRLR